MSKSRRGRGEGYVKRRPDGSWQGQLSLGTNPDGSRRRVFVNADTKTECLEKLAQKRAQANSRTLVSHDSVTVEGFLVRWMSAIRGSIADSTSESYQRNITKWILPVMGHLRMQRVDAIHVEEMMSRMSREDKSASLIKYVRTILRQAFNDAVRWQVVTRNPVELVPAPKPQHPEWVWWNEEQTRKAIEASKAERLGCVTVLGLLCGMRQGEILALQWKDIDFKRRKINIRRTHTYVGNKALIKDTKSRSGMRSIDIPSVALERLQDHKQRMMREGHLHQPFVFVDEQGQMLDRFGQAKSHFQRIIKATGNPEMGFHCTRHTHATLLFHAGTHPKVVQERLGHSSIKITLDTYSHVIPAMQAEAVDKLDKMFG